MGVEEDWVNKGDGFGFHCVKIGGAKRECKDKKKWHLPSEDI